MKTGRKPVSAGHRCRRFVISGIGTGGHYFPAIVIARELIGRDMHVVFLVRRGFPEESAARRYGLETLSVPAQGFYGASVYKKIVALLSYLRAVYRLYGIAKGITAVAFGGFGALPLIIASLLRRCEFFLFEPNRVPGRATRLFARKAKMVFLGMPPVTVIAGKTMVTGIPLRDEFTGRRTVHRTRSRAKTVLFFGGSGGARRLNELALELQHVLPPRYRVVIISGYRDYEWVVNNKTNRTRVMPFTHTPWDELKGADVVISRSGALAGCEILSLNVPAIFIPFPHAVDDHQWYNARYFTARGAGMVMRQEAVTAAGLAHAIKKLCAQKRPKIATIGDARQKICDFLQEKGT